MQKSGEHFHRSGFTATVRSDKTKNFPPGYGEGDVIDSSKVTKFFGKVFCLNCRTVIRCDPRRCRKDLVPIAHFFRQHGNVCVFNRRFACLLLQLWRCSCSKDPSTLHHDEPIEVFSLFHIGSCNDDAHPCMVDSHTFDKLPELTT